MATDKSVSELNQTTAVKDDDLYLVSQKNGSNKYESHGIKWSTIKTNIRTFLQSFFVRTDNTNQEIDGIKTFKGKFVYSGIEEADINANRTIWFSDNSTQGKPVYDNEFKYNPITNVLDVKKLNTGVELVDSPSDTDDSNKIATTKWVRKVIQVDDSTIVNEWISPDGNDRNDGKTKSTAKKTITDAMRVLNSYRLSSPAGLAIKLSISGNYDIHRDNTSNHPVIAHPDAINQNSLTIEGDPVSYGAGGNSNIQFPSTISTNQIINNYTWYGFIRPVVSNLSLNNIKFLGFLDKKNKEYATLCALDAPYTQLNMTNVAFANGFTHCFNYNVATQFIGLYSYVAFSSMSINLNAPRVMFWGSYGTKIDITGRTPHAEETKTQIQSLNATDCPKLVFKNISLCEWNILFHHTSPYTGMATRCDVVLDNVSCKISSNLPGVKLSSGSEYYCNIYCKTKEDLQRALPAVWELGRDSYDNPTGNDYNKVIIVGSDTENWPSWYDPNWDQNNM